jgi:hypothetical protein
MLLIDAANVIGSRPTGWWRDRSGAAHKFVDSVRLAARSGRLSDPVVIVLEGAARPGAAAGVADGVSVVHAPADGDETLVRLAGDAGGQVVLVSADRALRHRVEALGVEVVGPRWLLDRLEQ